MHSSLLDRLFEKENGGGAKGRKEGKSGDGRFIQRMYNMRNIADIIPKWKNIRIADILELSEIVLEIERKPEGEECLKYHTT